MASRFLVVVVAPCAALVFACDPLEPLDTPNASIAGLVCAGETGLPAKGASLVCSAGDVEVRTTADAAGHFLCRALPAQSGSGTVTLVDEDRLFEVPLVPGERADVIDTACRGLPADSYGAVEGVVCNRHTGSLVADALVSLHLFVAGAEEVRTTHSDADGHFLFTDVPTGSWLLVIEASGFQRAVRVDVVEGETFGVDLDGECDTGDGTAGYVAGALCDPAVGGPLVGARVVVADSVGDLHEGATSTDGSFELGPIVEGGAVVHVVREPDVELSQQVAIVAQQTVTAVFVQDCPDVVAEGEGEGEGDTDPPLGGARGHVCMFDGTTDLAGATVTVVLADGTRRTTTTDGDGDWQLDGLPVGTHTVTIEAGSFSTTVQVTVTEGAVVVLPDQDCTLDQSDVKIAVVEGIWDDVYTVLLDVGVEPGVIDSYDQLSGIAELFGDPTLLSTYDAVLVNCGADLTDFEDIPALRDNLADYVAAGGNLYASDLAYDVVEQTFPSFLAFVGDDAFFDSAEVGEVGDVQAQVVDPFLQLALGTQDIVLHYPLAIWAVMESAAPSVRVLIRGDAPFEDPETFGVSIVPDAPHTVMFRPVAGGGKVVFSSFHQEPGINVQQERVLQILMFQL